MILLSLLIINLIWIGYSLTEGVREGFYWHYENQSKKVCDFNVNPMFNIQRIIVLLLVNSVLVNIIGYYSILSSLCMILMFSFFHNGTYYYTRNKLNERYYPKRWTDESKTFPPYAPLLSYNKRTILMSIGFLAQVFIYLFLLHN